MRAKLISDGPLRRLGRLEGIGDDHNRNDNVFRLLCFVRACRSALALPARAVHVARAHRVGPPNVGSNYK
jgi:hypothetical protein